MNTPTSTQTLHRYLPFRRISPRTAVWSFAAGIALAFPFTVLIGLLPLPAPDAEMLRVSAARMAPLFTHPWFVALHALVIAPLWEESVYRGLMLQMLRRYWPLWLAVMIPTVIFAGTHFTFSYQNAALAAVVGVYFAWLAIRSRSLFTNILCHSGVNLAGVFIMRPIALDHGWTAKADLLHPLALTLLAGSVVLLVFATRALRAEFSRPSSTVADRSSPTLAAA